MYSARTAAIHRFSTAFAFFAKTFAVALVLLLLTLSYSQSSDSTNFSLTLERTGCLGPCPDYKLSVLADGSVRYEGQAYVRIKGIRADTIPASSIKKLIQTLSDVDFFHWQASYGVCLDIPEIRISAVSGDQRNKIVEGCGRPPKVLEFADQIDKLVNSKRWVGHTLQP